jgi:two-component system, chemotaxis family, protein-glutamate methylesterase/glutaminase
LKQPAAKRNKELRRLPEAERKRILVVDDAIVVRKTLSQAIAQDPALEVAGTATNGRFALEKFSSLKPDIVLLDVEMPEMDGLETVRALRKLDGRVPIIMFSTLTARGAGITLDALSLGASDYVTKPSNANMAATMAAITQELLPKIRAFCRLPGRGAYATPGKPVTPAPVLATSVRRLLAPVHIVAIGVSTGGPEALAQVISRLPADLKVPVVIAQHMPPIFTALLAERLSAKSALPVRECSSGEPVVPGCCLLAPGDFHMTIHHEDGVIRARTSQGAKENFCRPSVDVLFRSVAQVYGARTLAVILTGMGQDGWKGCEMLRGLGARIYVQDEATSVIWGMPGFVARSGMADKILPVNQIGPEITRATEETGLKQAAQTHF